MRALKLFAGVPPQPALPLPVTVVSLAGLLADLIRRLHGGESVDEMIVHR
jgi:hypothetical protein